MRVTILVLGASIGTSVLETSIGLAMLVVLMCVIDVRCRVSGSAGWFGLWERERAGVSC